jgi:hypothetical protein
VSANWNNSKLEKSTAHNCHDGTELNLIMAIICDTPK